MTDPLHIPHHTPGELPIWAVTIHYSVNIGTKTKDSWVECSMDTSWAFDPANEEGTMKDPMLIARCMSHYGHKVKAISVGSIERTKYLSHTSWMTKLTSGKATKPLPPAPTT